MFLIWINIFSFLYKSQERLESWHNHSKPLSLINWQHRSEGSLASSADVENCVRIFITFFNISSFTAHIQRFWTQIMNSAVFAGIFISQKWVFIPTWLLDSPVRMVFSTGLFQAVFIWLSTELSSGRGDQKVWRHSYCDITVVILGLPTPMAAI